MLNFSVGLRHDFLVFRTKQSDYWGKKDLVRQITNDLYLSKYPLVLLANYIVGVWKNLSFKRFIL